MKPKSLLELAIINLSLSVGVFLISWLISSLLGLPDFIKWGTALATIAGAIGQLVAPVALDKSIDSAIKHSREKEALLADKFLHLEGRINQLELENKDLKEKNIRIETFLDHLELDNLFEIIRSITGMRDELKHYLVVLPESIHEKWMSQTGRENMLISWLELRFGKAPSPPIN